MKIKVVIISILTLVLTFICIISSNTASAMVLYDSWDDLNGKQFYLDIDSLSDNQDYNITVTSYRDAFDSMNNASCNAYDPVHFGNIVLYDSNNTLLGEVEKITYCETSSFALFKVFTDNYVIVGDVDGEQYQFENVSYIVWEVPKNAFHWNSLEYGSEGLFFGPETSNPLRWRVMYGDFELISKYLSEDGNYAYNTGKVDGYKEGQSFGYNAGISANISDNTQKIYVDYEGKVETENALKILIAVSGVLVLVSGGFLIFLGIRNKINKTNNTKLKKVKRRKRKF